MKIWLDSIENELYRILPKHIDSSWVRKIFTPEETLSEFNLFDAICEPARDLMYSGGKRWRPLLMLLSAKMLGGQEAFEKAMTLVPLVEMPHNGSLIIDDIEDQSDLRRGKPATHITHGIDLSINAGSMLFFLPTVALDEAPISDVKRLLIYQIYAKYMRKIHMGQGMDIVWHHDIEGIPSIESYETMSRLKTGCLAAMGSEIGAAVAVDDMTIIEEAGMIAETIGLGFQILDDVINLEKGNPGKNRGDDIVENKKSLPVILYANAHPEKHEHLFSVFRHAQSNGYGASKVEILALIDEIIGSGVLEQARKRAHDLFQGVLEMINEVYGASQERDLLISMVEGFKKA
jgi:octaprenyl-diphosphate synthase